MRTFIIAACIVGAGCGSQIIDPGGGEPDIAGVYCMARFNAQMLPTTWNDVELIGGMLHLTREGGPLRYEDRVGTRTAEGEEVVTTLTGKSIGTVQPDGIDEYILETMRAVAKGDSLVLRLRNFSSTDTWTYRRGIEPCF